MMGCDIRYILNCMWFLINTYSMIISLFINLILSNKWVWGFSIEAELWNGRLAMLAFILIVLIEFVYSCSILDLLGIFRL